MKLSLADDVRNGMLEVIAEKIDAGGSAGRIELRDERGAVLSVLRFSQPSAGKISQGTLQFGEIKEDRAARGDGLATLATITDSQGSVVFECDVTDINGDGVIKLNSNEIAAGGPVRITSFRLSAASRMA